MRSSTGRNLLLGSLLLLAPTAHAATANLLVDGALTTGLGAGVDSSGHRTDWLSKGDGFLRMAYPSGQAWGAVFFTVGGDPLPPPRPSRDYSGYTQMNVVLRGAQGGEEVEIGIKDSADPDDGTEVKKKVTVTPDWQTYTFPLADFSTANLHAVYVVAEFVFEGGTGSTVDVQSVSYESSGSSGGEIDGSLAGQATIIAGRKKTQPLQLAVVARNGTWSASDVASRLSVFGTFVRKGNLLNLTIDATSTLLLSDYLGATTGGNPTAFGLKNFHGNLRLKRHGTLGIFTLSSRFTGTHGRLKVRATGPLMTVSAIRGPSMFAASDTGRLVGGEFVPACS